MTRPTLQQLIDEAERELGTKRIVYPRWVAENKISQATADHRLACQTATLDLLVSIRNSLCGAPGKPAEQAELALNVQQGQPYTQ